MYFRRYKRIRGKVFSTIDGNEYVKSKISERYRYLKCDVFRGNYKGTSKLTKQTNAIIHLHNHNNKLEDYKTDIYQLKTKCKTLVKHS